MRWLFATVGLGIFGERRIKAVAGVRNDEPVLVTIFARVVLADIASGSRHLMNWKWIYARK